MTYAILHLHFITYPILVMWPFRELVEPDVDATEDAALADMSSRCLNIIYHSKHSTKQMDN